MEIKTSNKPLLNRSAHALNEKWAVILTFHTARVGLTLVAGTRYWCAMYIRLHANSAPPPDDVKPGLGYSFGIPNQEQFLVLLPPKIKHKKEK